MIDERHFVLMLNIDSDKSLREKKAARGAHSQKSSSSEGTLCFMGDSNF